MKRKHIRKVQFQRYGLTDDGFSQVENWADHGAYFFAEKRDASDSERFRSGEVSSQITARFLVRYCDFTADLTTKDRLTCEGRGFNIVGIKEADGEKPHQRFFEITAAARSDQ